MKVGDIVYYVFPVYEDRYKTNPRLKVYRTSVVTKVSKNRYYLECDTGSIVAGTSKQKKAFKTRKEAQRYIDWRVRLEKKKREYAEPRKGEKVY